MRKDLDWNQINLAINCGYISESNFDIDVNLIEKVALLKMNDINSFLKISRNRQISLWNLYCRTAALNLLKFKDCFDIDKSYNQAFIYIMKNKTNPNLYKIGRSIEPDVRVKTANTFCPYRGFEIISFRYSQNAISLEKEIHEIYSDYNESGEWFFFNDILSVINKINSKCEEFLLPV